MTAAAEEAPVGTDEDGERGTVDEGDGSQVERDLAVTILRRAELGSECARGGDVELTSGSDDGAVEFAGGWMCVSEHGCGMRGRPCTSLSSSCDGGVQASTRKLNIIPSWLCSAMWQ